MQLKRKYFCECVRYLLGTQLLLLCVKPVIHRGKVLVSLGKNFKSKGRNFSLERKLKGILVRGGNQN